MRDPRRHTILVIDDEEDIRASLAEILEDEGYAVLAASNGKEGLRLALEHTPDLVLSDVRMEGMDGLTLVSRLAEKPSTASIPVVLMTAHPGEQGQRLALELGADGYLPKPFSAEHMLRTLRARLRRREAQARETEERVGRVCSSLSLALPHELRTPLAAIIAGVSLLTKEDRPLPWEVVVRVGRAVESSSRRLLDLVERFLAYARLELAAADPAMMENLEASSCPRPGEAAAAAAEEAAARAGRESDLHLSIEEVPVPMACEHVNRLVRELADNAFKFSPPETPVTVNARPGPSHWVVTVSDRGRGMTPAQVKALDAGVQFDRRVHEQQGAGLGLAIVRSILTLWGGRLELEPGREGGLTVRTWVPRSAPSRSGPPSNRPEAP